MKTLRGGTHTCKNAQRGDTNNQFCGKSRPISAIGPGEFEDAGIFPVTLGDMDAYAGLPIMIAPRSLLAVLPLIVPVPASAALAWIGNANGGDGESIYQEANWDADGDPSAPYTTPPAGTVDPNNAINDALIVTGGTPGGSGGGGANLWLGDTGSLTVSGGTFRMSQGGAAGIHADGTVGGARSTIDLSGTSSLFAQFLADQTVTIIDGALLTLYGGGNPVNNSVIDYSTNWGGSVSFLNETPGAVTSEHLGKFTVGGAAAIVGTDPTVAEPGDNMLIVSDGGAGSVLTVIPEPSTTILGALAMLFGLRRRR